MTDSIRYRREVLFGLSDAIANSPSLEDIESLISNFQFSEETIDAIVTVWASAETAEIAREEINSIFTS